MTRAIFFLSLPLLLASQSVWAANSTIGGHNAVALAGVVAPYSPTLTPGQKVVMAKLFEGHDPTSPPITITADSITCFAGDVAINTFNCDLKFGTHTINVTGRKAHEIFATLIEAGVPANGTAGKIYEALLLLSCTIDPNQIKQNSGAGASCTFTPN
jgi:hypothetical protein